MMNTLLNLYFKLPHDRFLGISSKILNRLAAKIVKPILDDTVPEEFLKTQTYFPKGVNSTPREKKVVISFTSFPGRIADVWIVVECIFRQTYKADKIILWLDETKFTMDSLPEKLKNQFPRGLEVRLVKDLRSHTKYFYALQEFKKCYVITIDDDCYYPENLVSNLMSINNKFPNSIASNRIHKLTFQGNKVQPYKKWYHNYNPSEMVNNKFLITGVSGVLYPPHIFDEAVFDSAVLIEKCRFADDIWLSINAFRLNIDVASNNVFNKDMIAISKSAEVRLLNFNSKGNGNDDQLAAVVQHYNIPSLIDIVQKNWR